MIEKVKENIEEYEIKAVFGGFHLFNPINKKCEKEEYVYNLSESLSNTDIVFYTGHCTGGKNYEIIEKKLNNRINTMNCGEINLV